MRLRPFMSNSAFVLLKILAEAPEDSEERELTLSGDECWNGTNRVSARVFAELLRLCLIREEYNNGIDEDVYIAYTAYPEAKKVINDPSYEPEILRILRNREWRKI